MENENELNEQKNIDESCVENNSAETNEKPKTSKKNEISAYLKEFFSPLRMTYLALFTALAYIMYLPVFEFSVFPAVPFLKIDFSNAFVLIAGFTLGPVSGVIVGILKELLHGLTFSQTVGVGELANVLLLLPYVLIPSIVYKKHKGIKTVLILLACASLAQTVLSFPVNYTLTFPFFMKLYMSYSWKQGMNFYLDVWYWAVLFNLIKTVLLSIAVFLIYKPLSKLIKMTNKKFSKKKKNDDSQNETADGEKNE